MQPLPKLVGAIALLVVSCAALPSASPPDGRLPSFADVPPYGGPPNIVVPQDAVLVPVGTDIPHLVAAGNGSTTYFLEPGIHRLLQPIVPRNNDVFIGEPGAILSGAVILSPSGRDGDHWYVDGLRLDTRLHGECRNDSPMCGFRHQAFLDGNLLLMVPSRQLLVPGTWTYDGEERRAYFYDDPFQRQLELSITRHAFESTADDVVIAGLVIERFANPAQSGAIMAERVVGERQFGSRWTITGNEVRENHGIGIRAGRGSWIVANHVHHNGQLGISTLGPGPTKVEGNEIAYNNTAGFSEGWEAGGTKFIRTDGLVVRHNLVHNNQGPGLWTDIDNIRTLYEHNVVRDNSHTGIFHEISYDAVIRFNQVIDNGIGLGREEHVYVFGAGILVANSRNVLVQGNLVTGNWNGIVGLQQQRGSGTHGPWELSGLRVINNEVEMGYHSEGVSGDGRRGIAAVTGVVQDAGFHEIFSRDYANLFVGNSYAVSSVDRNHFAWGNSWIDFESWQRCDGDLASWEGCEQDSTGEIRVRGR